MKCEDFAKQTALWVVIPTREPSAPRCFFPIDRFRRFGGAGVVALCGMFLRLAHRVLCHCAFSTRTAAAMSRGWNRRGRRRAAGTAWHQPSRSDVSGARRLRRIRSTRAVRARSVNFFSAARSCPRPAPTPPSRSPPTRRPRGSSTAPATSRSRRACVGPASASSRSSRSRATPRTPS